MELLNYLLKVSACSALFFAFYLLVLRKLTFFKINRFYLLTSLVISFIIPAMQFTIEREVEVPKEVAEPLVVKEVDLGASNTQTPIIVGTAPSTAEIEHFDWLALLPFLYGAIVASLLLLAVWRVIKLLKHTKASVKEINGLKLVAKEKGFTNCSFFNYVFIDENSLTESELAILLAHEEVHARQYHSVDKLLMMVAKAVLWFNPIVYLYDKALEQAHEYEADETTSLNVGAEHYANLLLKLAVSKGSSPLIHNFVKSPIKERIKMLFNSKSKNMKKLAYLLALPIGLALVWGFTVDVVKVFPAQEKEFTLVIDAGHGGKDKGTEIGNYSEKAIALSMAKKIKAMAEAKGIKVVTTRDADQKISLQERIKADGSILISLHVNSEPVNNDGKRNGIEIFTAPNDGSLKIAKANSIGHYVFKGIQNVQGISSKENPQAKNLFLLREAKMPGIVLELGYLTNRNDLKFITNEAKQNELAEGIVNGILAYKEKIPSDEKPQQVDTLAGKTFKGRVIGFEKRILRLKTDRTVLRISGNEFKDKVKIGDEITVVIRGKVILPPPPIGTPNLFKDIEASYVASKVVGAKGQLIYEYKEQHYAFGYEANRARYANSKIKTIEKNADGTINKIVLNDEHGFTINLNVAAQRFKSSDFKKGDKILVKFIGEKLTDNKTYTTDKMIALYSWPIKHKLINKALYPKFYDENGRQKVYDKSGKQIIDHDDLNLANVTPIKVFPKQVLLSSSTLTVNNKTKIYYAKDAIMKLFDGQLEAEEAEMDWTNDIITAKKAKFKTKKGGLIESDFMVFDAKKGTINANVVQGKSNAQGLKAFSKITYSANDSVVVSKANQTVKLYGDAQVKY